MELTQVYFEITFQIFLNRRIFIFLKFLKNYIYCRIPNNQVCTILLRLLILKFSSNFKYSQIINTWFKLTYF